MERWAFWAYVAMAVLVVAGGLAKDIPLKTAGRTTIGWSGIILPWAIVAVLGFLVGVYVKRALTEVEPNKGAAPNGGPVA